MTVKKAPIKLALFGEPEDPRQKEFERAAINELHLKPGVLAVDGAQTRYINPNVQWLWVQFQKGE